MPAPIDQWIDDDGVEHIVEELNAKGRGAKRVYLFYCSHGGTWVNTPRGDFPADGFYKSIAIGRRVFGRVRP